MTRQYPKLRRILSPLLTALLGALCGSAASAGVGRHPATVSSQALETFHADAVLKHPTDTYVEEWVPFPKLEGHTLNEERRIVEPRHGTFEVYISLASWCVPCQDVVPDLMTLEERFRDYPVRFTYIFHHDTVADVRGFLRVHPLRNPLLASDQVQKSLHNPNLPSYHLADRWGWFLGRGLIQSRADLAEIERRVYQATSY